MADGKEYFRNFMSDNPTPVPVLQACNFRLSRPQAVSSGL